MVEDVIVVIKVVVKVVLLIQLQRCLRGTKKNCCLSWDCCPCFFLVLIFLTLVVVVHLCSKQAQ